MEFSASILAAVNLGRSVRSSCLLNCRQKGYVPQRRKTLSDVLCFCLMYRTMYRTMYGDKVSGVTCSICTLFQQRTSQSQELRKRLHAHDSLIWRYRAGCLKLYGKKV
jgi:hypothetical protein